MLACDIARPDATLPYNHQQEKLEALRNVAINSALPNAAADDRQMMFLGFVDTLTPWHLRALKLFDDPSGWGEQRNIEWPSWTIGGLANVLVPAYPELQDQRPLYDQVWRDLFGRWLTSTDSLHVTMSRSALFEARTSELG